MIRSNKSNRLQPNQLRRLRDIDLRVNGTLAMLHDFPQLEQKVLN